MEGFNEKQQYLFNIEPKQNVESLKKIVAVLSTQIQQQKLIIDTLLKNKKNIQTPVITLKELAEKFLSYSKSNHTLNTYNRNLSLLKKIYSFFDKNDYISNITSEQIEKYKSLRKQNITPQGNKVSNATINRELALLKAMFNKAKIWGFINYNPFEKVKLLKEDERSITFLKKNEIKLLLNSKLYNNKLYAHYKPLVIIGINTGMRLGEILNLKWEQINFQQNIITLKKTKSHKVRNIPMNENLKTFLLQHKNNSKSEYVITYYNGKKIKKLHRGWKNFLQKSGIKRYYRFHDLRHTFASYLVMNNVDITTVQKLLGHSDIQTTMRYSHISDKHAIEAVEKININI